MNLTCLDNVKGWLAIDLATTTSDPILNRLIVALSNAITSYLQRPAFVKTTFNETLSGIGSRAIMLRNWPVLSILSLNVNNTNVPPAINSNAYGYSLEQWDGSMPGKPQLLYLNGITGSGPVGNWNGGWNAPQAVSPGSLGFNPGANNIIASYVAGYCVQNEAHNVPAATTYTLNPLVPNGLFSQDDGVNYANGTALTKVSLNPPLQGQYSVSVVAATGVATYTFNAADASAAVLLNYSYIPADLEQACIEWVGERYSYKGRIGQISKSLGGQESVTYGQKDMPDFIKRSLMPYRKSFPL